MKIALVTYAMPVADQVTVEMLKAGVPGTTSGRCPSEVHLLDIQTPEEDYAWFGMEHGKMLGRVIRKGWKKRFECTSS